MKKSQVSSTVKTIRNPTLLLGKRLKKRKEIKTTNNKTPTSYAPCYQNRGKKNSVIEKITPKTYRNSFNKTKIKKSEIKIHLITPPPTTEQTKEQPTRTREQVEIVFECFVGLPKDVKKRNTQISVCRPATNMNRSKNVLKESYH